jgi:hypothetical protein
LIADEGNDQLLEDEQSIVVPDDSILVNKEKAKLTVPQGKPDKIENVLADKMQKMGIGEKVRVAIWAKADDLQPRERPEAEISRKDMEKISRSNLAYMKDAISKKLKPIKDHLNSKNIKILYEDSLAPVMFAELTADEINELKANDDVIAIDLGRDNYHDLIDTSAPAILAPPVWLLGGSGTRVAVVEQGRIAFENPYLNDGISYNSLNPISYHTTGVAGIIASRNTTYKGVAYNGPALLSANSGDYEDDHVMAAANWAITNGARVLSNSWGFEEVTDSLTPIAKWYDWVVRFYGVTAVFAAGNSGNSAPPLNKVVDPARAYNVIAVGSFDDMNTGWVWGDDQMSFFSSYANPGREKPEVAAVGWDGVSDPTWIGGIMSTTDTSPWIGPHQYGTSYAAPQVSGVASLLIDKRSFLGVWPETVKAIIMASADHNIEGSSRLSDKDGAGGVNAQEAYKIASQAKGTSWNGSNISYGTGAPWYGPNFTASMGQKVRVVIAWDSVSTGYDGSDTLNSDLDLSIQRLQGFTLKQRTWVLERRAGSSTSASDNFEIVEFNAPATGEYRAKVTKSSWSNPNQNEYLGYAAYVK